MADSGYTERLVGASHDAFLSLVYTNQINGLEYNNTLVSGPGITDVFDPNVKTLPLLVASYWPGGVADTTHNYIVHAEDADSSNQERLNNQRFIQELLLGATIGEAAMERLRASGAEDYQQEASRALGPMLVPGLLDVCAHFDAPYSMLMVGEVAESTIIEPGERVGLLYFLGAAPVKNALSRLRRQAQDRAVAGN